jgi:ABC-2 type transport system ATP-binding protein
VAAVRVSGLVKRFDGTSALDGVDLEVREGEIRGLLGPNGAGKTTLLRTLFGLLRPDSGSIELLGRLRDPLAPGPLDGVAGFVEDPTFYPYLSGRANLELLSELDGAPPARSIDELLEMVGLANRARDRVSNYSTGMRQRLGIAAALLRAPRLLLLDEPTSGLDPAGARQVGVLLRELAAQGVAVLVSSHLISSFEQVCDGFTVLHRGRVVWNGNLEDLRRQAPASAYALGTSDDERALGLADAQPGIRASRSQRGGLALAVDGGELDAYVIALGRAGIAVRRLELLVSPLESMFFALTSDVRVTELEPDELAEKALAAR